MLKIKKTVITEISDIFSKSDYEQGFLLACTTKLNYIDRCHLLDAAASGMYFYEPDSFAANKIIQAWRNNGICFCGLIHSHTIRKLDLSENDIDFAKQLYLIYKLPVLWFGVGIVDSNDVIFRFFSVSQCEKDIVIVPVEIAILEHK